MVKSFLPLQFSLKLSFALIKVFTRPKTKGGSFKLILRRDNLKRGLAMTYVFSKTFLVAATAFSKKLHLTFQSVSEPNLLLSF